MTSEVEERPRFVTGGYGRHRRQWVKKETKNLRGGESECKVILDCIAAANHSNYRQVLGHDSFHGTENFE